jgi:hypothetical protein
MEASEEEVGSWFWMREVMRRIWLVLGDRRTSEDVDFTLVCWES